jgi:tetratricopeptide (TPR) repeat protein
MTTENDDELARLRGAGDLAGLTDALGVRGARALDAGAWAQAIELLEESASVAEAVQRPGHAAQALVGVVTALRGSGRLDEAAATARRAIALAPGGPSRVAALTALGECLRTTGDHAGSLEAYSEALELGREAGLLPVNQAGLLRRRGEALRALGRTDESVAALSAAIEAYGGAGAGEPLRDTLVERAAALIAAPEAPWQEAIGSARTAAERAGDQALLADLAVLEATRAAAARDLPAAIEWAERARQLALDGDAPLTYTAAAIALAGLKERAGDRVGAYGALAVGWVTLADKLGGETAAAWFRPALTDARARWGEEAFQSVKETYYAQRPSVAPR